MQSTRNITRETVEEVFLLRDNELLGPFPRDEAERRLKDGSIGGNELVKIGRKGRAFPAAALLQEQQE